MLPRSLNTLVVWVIYLSLSFTANAVPTIVYGLMAQAPPVARVGSPFLFDLFPGSFNSTSTISYSVSGLPAWLTWSDTALSFTGTPSAGDVGEQVVQLTATDATGSVSDNFTLITTTYTIPGVHQSFTTQIADPSSRVFSSVTPMPGDTGVTVPPYWSFSLGFAWDTFRLSKTDPTNGKLFFMAHERGTVNLPSWLVFNNETMTFNGSAPSNGSFTIVATGTDFWGYTGAQTSFVIQVGEGYPIETVKGGNFSNLNAVARQQVDYTVSLDEVLYNGTQATENQVALSVDSPDFSWLSLEGTKMTGQVPDSYINGSDAALFIPLTIASRNTSSTLSLLTWIPFDVTPYLFNTFNLPAVSTKPSQEVLVDVAPYIANSLATVNATVSPSDAATWLVYHADNSSLVGMVPKSPNYDTVNVTFSAVQGNQTATTGLQINIAGAPSNNGDQGSAPVPVDKHGKGLSKGAKIGIAIGSVIAGLLLLLLLLWCCCYRRRRNQEPDEKQVDDDASFVARSPPLDPFRRSQGLDAPRHLNLLGEIARFSGLGLRNPTDVNRRSQDQPQRMGGLNGIFTLADEKEANKHALETPRLTQSSSSFLGHGDVIGVIEPEDSRPSQDASSFTQSFDSESDRASWESPDSFTWSSGENGDLEGTPRRHRTSTTPSIPRPRADFTPRYPRNNSPTVLAQLASQHSLGMTQQELSSGSGSGSGHEDGSMGTFSGAGSIVNSDFPSGPSGLNRFGSGFRSIDEEDENTSGEEAAVVSMAERQSFETRQPVRPTPKLRPSKERMASPNDTFGDRSPQSRQALVERQGGDDGIYDDAEEYRRSMVGREGVGLGYPASAIFGGSDYADDNGGYQRNSTITAIPPHENPLSPPLPQVGSFVRQLHSANGMRSPPGAANDGRVVACANETFSVHPQINPPPTVSLSAATWSSAPPSTYRAEVEGGGQLPSWLHFDARELELWGVPSMNHSGEVTVIRIIEKLPRDKRRSDPMAFGYEPQQEREVGRIAIEVVDRIKSPQFALENSPHAM